MGEIIFPFCILLSLVEANLHHIRTFFSKKRFLNAPTKSREGNLDSFLLLFLIFCLLYKKQIDPNDIGKVRKNLKEKTKSKKIRCDVKFLSKEKLRTSSLSEYLKNNIIIVFACNCYVSFFLRVRITQTKKEKKNNRRPPKHLFFLMVLKKTATNFIGIPNTCFI